MALDRIAAVFKVGDKITAPGKEYLGIKHGMPICYIDEAEWKMPLERILSPNNYRVFCVVEIDRSMKPWLVDNLSPIGFDKDGNPDPTKYKPRPYKVDFASLESKAKVSDLEAKLLSTIESVDLLDGKSITFDDFRVADVQDAAIVKDFNAVSFGSYTVGTNPTDDYATWALAFADIANLTDDLTFTQTTDVTETTRSVVTELLNNHTLTCTASPYHGAVQSSGNLISINHALDSFSIQAEGPGTFILQNLNSKRIAAAANRAAIRITSITTGFDCYINNNLFDSNGGLSRDGIGISDASPVLYAYNNEIWDFRNGIVCFAGNALSIYENNSIYNATNSFNIGSCPGTFNNNFGDGAFRLPGNATGNNNASTDASAADGNWSVGNNNLINQVAANCFESLLDADDDFLDITEGGPLEGAGIANTLARTTCIRGRTVPGPNGTSIGAAEVQFPPQPVDSTGFGARNPRTRQYWKRMFTHKMAH